MLGEARGGEGHELVAPLLAPLGQPPCHGANGTRLDRPVKNAGAGSRDSCAVRETPGSHAVRRFLGHGDLRRAPVAARPPRCAGQVASRIGAVRGDVVGIDILERGGGRAIDELVVDLPDGVAARAPRAGDPAGRRGRRRGGAAGRRRPARPPARRPGDGGDPRRAPPTATSSCRRSCEHARRAVGAEWSAVVELDGRRGARRRRARCRRRRGWRRSSTAAGRRPGWPAGVTGPDDVVWAPLPVGAASRSWSGGRHRLPSPGAPAGRGARPHRRHPPARDRPLRRARPPPVRHPLADGRCPTCPPVAPQPLRAVRRRPRCPRASQRVADDAAAPRRRRSSHVVGRLDGRRPIVGRSPAGVGAARHGCRRSSSPGGVEAPVGAISSGDATRPRPGRPGRRRRARSSPGPPGATPAPGAGRPGAGAAGRWPPRRRRPCSAADRVARRARSWRRRRRGSGAPSPRARPGRGGPGRCRG